MIFKVKTMWLAIIISLLMIGCTRDKDVKPNQQKSGVSFTQIPAETSNVIFSNSVVEDNSFNFLNYAYIYLGGGVATGDINNDGLVDIYFGSNQNDNKLFLNKGSFEFEDITTSANISSKDGWTTGVSMIDINNDGWLDIYVCKSASMNSPALRENKLYINQKDNSFLEKGEEWGVNDSGYSIQSYFLDYDKDGDLDMFVVNHRPDFVNNSKISSKIQSIVVQESSDQIYRNDGTHFVNVSKEAGIQNKAWGLSASIGDFNGDGWPDVYVCNDFLEPDNLYINQKNGTFVDEIRYRLRHITFYSMGSDIADINNDAYMDLCALDMTPSDHIRSKENMASMDTKGFNTMVRVGYHHQYMVNGLQVNNGSGLFSDIGQMAGIAKTDWSWAPLLADFDDDGFKDLFITNGIVKDISNRDFRIMIREKNERGESMSLTDLLGLVPEKRISNYMFQNDQTLRFKNKTSEWGLDQPSYSNGAAYADLDNDGDLDLIVNNAKDNAFLYKNNCTNNSLQVELVGPSKNTMGIGSKVTIKVKEQSQVLEQYLNRGFQSSVSGILHFGVGDHDVIDSVTVEWPDGKISQKLNVDANTKLKINYADAINAKVKKNNHPKLVNRINNKESGISFKHVENEFYDFKEQVLLPHSESKNGPFITKGDVNGDNLDDIFIGGALGQAGELFIQNSDMTFSKAISQPWEKDKNYEDLGVLFFDYDLDGDQDLYVVSGGTERDLPSKFFQDRLYENNGSGQFKKTTNVLPKLAISGQSVCAGDVDGDGDLDLFIGGRIIPNKYPFSPNSSLLINNNGVFTDVTKEMTPELGSIGMVSDAVFSDYDGDGDLDLLAVGEWSNIQLFENNKSVFTKKEIPAFENTTGLWFSIKSEDIDNDGDQDFFVGNLGLNAKYRATEKKEFHIFCSDFDNSGTYDIVLSSKYKGELVPIRGKQCSTEQMPDIQTKFPSYKQFAEANVNDMFSNDQLEDALHFQANSLSSVYLENQGEGNFSIQELPNDVQISPILDFEFLDIDMDGQKEVICIGNMFNSEVETQRYDASYGSILKFDQQKFKAISPIKTGLSTSGDAKDVELININQKTWLIITNNNGQPDIFQSN